MKEPEIPAICVTTPPPIDTLRSVIAATLYVFSRGSSAVIAGGPDFVFAVTVTSTTATAFLNCLPGEIAMGNPSVVLFFTIGLSDPGSFTSRSSSEPSSSRRSPMISLVSCICSFKMSEAETEYEVGSEVLGAGAVTAGGFASGAVVTTF